MTTRTADRIEVCLGERSYPIIIGAKLLASAGEHISNCLGIKRVIVIADHALENAGHLATLRASLLAAGHQTEILHRPGGEHSKRFEVLSGLLEDALALGVDRKTAIVAFGGGVIGDLAGFVASILLRGVDLVQIPTTLLSQVDSSVGGKTGINSLHGKNLIGSFYQPKLVLIDTSVLDSLGMRELKAGYAEVIKYGCLADADFFDWLEIHGSEVIGGDAQARAYAIRRSCEIKAGIVGEDEFETSGRRALLNFGHTFAHGYEALAGYGGVVLHGEAVSVGMTRAAKLSTKLGLGSTEEAERLESHLKELGLPVRPADLRNEAFDASAMLDAMRKDKKAENGAMRFVLWRGIGKAFLHKSVPEPLVEELLRGHD